MIEHNRTSVVVCDSSPLIALSKINQLSLLVKIFKTIIIPNSVFYECTVKSIFDDSNAIKKLKDNKNVQIKKALESDQLHQDPDLRSIDQGEREAIILAVRCEPKAIILIDEEKGRAVAKFFSLAVVGTCGLLVFACEKGFISKDNVRNYIFFLQKNNYRLSERLIAKTLDSIRNFN